MIGDYYNVDSWNCTHEVAQWYRINKYPHLLEVVSPDEWGIKFVRWMRKRFDRIDVPEQGALVLMVNKGVGGRHVGVWDHGMVHHCYQPLDGKLGQTIRSPLSMIKSTHKDLTFWRMRNV